MFTLTTCTILSCDECKKPIPDSSGDYEGSPHFDSEAAALAALGWDPDDEEQRSDTPDRGWLAGYQLVADTLPGRPAGQVLCFTCLVSLVCAVRGHRWDDWLRCRCGTNSGEPCTPRIPSHRDSGCPEIRRCDRSNCYERQERPVGAGDTAEVTV